MSEREEDCGMARIEFDPNMTHSDEDDEDHEALQYADDADWLAEFDEVRITMVRPLTSRDLRELGKRLGNPAEHEALMPPTSSSRFSRSIRIFATASAQTPSSEPAECGLILLAFATKLSERESVLGDICEQHARNVERFGPRWARAIFWRDVLASTFHFVMRALWRPAAALLAAVGVTKIFG